MSLHRILTRPRDGRTYVNYQDPDGTNWWRRFPDRAEADRFVGSKVGATVVELDWDGELERHRRKMAELGVAAAMKRIRFRVTLEVEAIRVPDTFEFHTPICGDLAWSIASAAKEAISAELEVDPGFVCVAPGGLKEIA